MLYQRLITLHSKRLPTLLRNLPGQRRRLHSKLPAGAERFITISEEVQDALATGKPIVALESTIYTHGLPYPQNASLAQGLESIIRKEGAVPATIGVINGVARIGLIGEEVTELASAAEHSKVLKISRRDLSYIMGLGLRGKGIYGGTTVAGTSVLANMAGIKVFATGGLGGVHRGGETSMDVSADLTELGRTPIAVVCSGCKSFLDIPRTLEYLETEGVMVGVFADGRRGNIDFPGFYSRDSGVKAPKVIEDEVDAAAMIYANHAMKLSSGLVLANPVPEKSDLKKEEMDRIIKKALDEARQSEILGSDNTPFVLAKIKELSNGRSVIANTALVEANVARGARVAVELAKLERDMVLSERSKIFIPASTTEKKADVQPLPTVAPVSSYEKKGSNVVVAGSVAIDFACDYAPLMKDAGSQPVLQVSNPSVISQSLGGVGHNVARAVNYMGISTTLCSVIADDLGGRTILSELQREGIRTDGIAILNPKAGNKRTAQYIAVNDTKKDLMVAMADMSILETEAEELDFEGQWESLITQENPDWLVIDANWSPKSISRWVSLARRTKTRIAFEPVSAPKSARLSRMDGNSKTINDLAIKSTDVVPNNAIDLASPNNFELTAMWEAAREAGHLESEEWFSVIDSFNITAGAGTRQRMEYICGKEIVDQGVPQQNIQLLPYIPCIITKLGPKGALLTQIISSDDPRLTSPDHMKYILGRALIPQKGVNVIGGIYMRLFPPAEMVDSKDIISVNGVGDTLLGTVIAGLSVHSDDKYKACLENIIPVSQKASVETLKSAAAISPSISKFAKELKAIEY